jgi:hypothetical protein
MPQNLQAAHHVSTFLPALVAAMAYMLAPDVMQADQNSRWQSCLAIRKVAVL